MKTTFLRLLALLAAFTLGGALAAPILEAESEVATATKDEPAPQLRLPAAKGAPAVVRMPAVTAGEIASVRSRNNAVGAKVVVIGVNRALDGLGDNVAAARAPAGSEVAGGFASRLAVASPDAAALRLGLDLRGTHPDVEMVFFGSDSARLMGPVRVGSIPDRMALYWSPVTEGETQSVEFFAPAGVPAAQAGAVVRSVSHLFSGPASGFRKNTIDIGRGESCNVDIACKTAPSAAFLNARNAVAKMVQTDGSFSGLCTGTLLNDIDTSTSLAWFYTANHCFENESAPLKTPAQMQTVANTLNTYWFFEATSCGSSTPISFVQRSGGALLVYSNAVSDVLFLRLVDSPPSGAVFAGWNANTLPTSTAITGIHHPVGDLKKYSEGSMIGFRTSPAYLAASGGSFNEVVWSVGTTNGGSSGSGLFTDNGTSFQLRGGLAGGGASCSSRTSPDQYSRLDLAFTALSPYLAGSGPFADFTDLWYNANESGWGLSLTQHSTNTMFGVWYTYDAQGKRLWVVMPGGAWSSSTTFTGNLYITSGPPQNTGTFNPNLVKSTLVGTGTLVFSTAGAGTWSYTINGVSGSKSIVRQGF